MLTVMRRNGQRMVQYFQASVLQMVQLCKHVNNWLVKSIHTYLNALCIYILLAKTKLNTKRLVANLIIQVQLIKVGLINVLHKAGDLGQQLLTIAHRIRQHVKQVFQQGV
jgi:hypothetical protein